MATGAAGHFDFNDYGGQPSPGAAASDPIQAFKSAMAAEGYTLPGDPVPDGKLQRFAHEDKNGAKCGWYVFHADGIPAGSFGDWRTGRTFTWCAKKATEFSPAEREDFRHRIEQQKRIRDQERQQRQESAARQAKAEWDAAQPASPDHPYLKKKAVAGYGVRQDASGRLLVPVRDHGGNLTSLQTIDTDGGKLFLTGGRKKGCCHAIKGADPATYYLCEGYATSATIYEATGGNVVVCFDAGNLLPVAETIRERHPAARIVFCADDDQWKKENAGVTKATEAAVKVDGEVVVPKFQDLSTEPTDFNDLATLEGIGEVKRQIQNAKPLKPEQEAQPAGRFTFLSLGDLIKQPAPLQWLVKHFLTVNCFALLFAKAGMVKSFLSIAIGMAVATGRPWMGQKILSQGPVFYIAGEGFSGLPARLKAYTLANSITDPDQVPFFVSNQAVQVLDPASVAAMVAEIEVMGQRHGNPSLIVLDTLARTFGPGNENDTADMSAFVSALDRIRFRYGCAILIVHHSGLADADRSRGSSALRAALDFEYKIEPVDETVRRLVCTKAKDCEEPSAVYFESKQVGLGWTDPESGEEVASIVLERVPAPSTCQPGPRLTGSRRVAFDALKRVIRDKTESQPHDDPGRFLDSMMIHLDEWREAAYAAGISNSTDQAAKQKAFKRAVSALRDAQLVGCKDDQYWSL